MKISRQLQREDLPSPLVALGPGWEVYEVPEAVVGQPLSSSRSHKAFQTRPVGAILETTEGIEILFFPRSA